MPITTPNNRPKGWLCFSFSSCCLAIDKASSSKTSKKAFSCLFSLILVRCAFTIASIVLPPDFNSACISKIEECSV